MRHRGLVVFVTGVVGLAALAVLGIASAGTQHCCHAFVEEALVEIDGGWRATLTATPCEVATASAATL